MHKDRSERGGYHFNKEKVGLGGNLTAAVWQVEYIGTIEGVLIQTEGDARSCRCTQQRGLGAYGETTRTKDGGISTMRRALMPLVTQSPASGQPRH